MGADLHTSPARRVRGDARPRCQHQRATAAFVLIGAPPPHVDLNHSRC
jgi:hypothetical protein